MHKILYGMEWEDAVKHRKHVRYVEDIVDRRWRYTQKTEINICEK